MRLDKFLSNSGKGSRKDIKQLLKTGSVTVNGKVVNDGSVHISETEDEIAVDGITGATVTSKAVARCVNSAIGYVTGADATSSATTWGG